MTTRRLREQPTLSHMDPQAKRRVVTRWCGLTCAPVSRLKTNIASLSYVNRLLRIGYLCESRSQRYFRLAVPLINGIRFAHERRYLGLSYSASILTRGTVAVCIPTVTRNTSSTLMTTSFYFVGFE